jgi:glutamate-1-semialdehyde 2,1-aminomutase
LISEMLERGTMIVGLLASLGGERAGGGGWLILGLGLGLGVLALVGRSLVAAWWTLRARSWTPALSRHLALWVRARPYSDEAFFRADGAREPLIERRKAGMERLARFFRAEYPRSMAWGDSIREGLSDLRFTDANRVPFPFAQFMREHFNLCSVVTASDGPRLRDLDGHWTLDVSGAYGVNVAGFDRAKEWMARGLERVGDLGPVLGPLHPVVADNIARLRAISGLDEVSFHMSGTEAVMAAVRLARFNTGRKLIVCFAGAYHGWWDGVQPGLGSERALGDCLTLKDVRPASLKAIRRRAGEIAAVLVNPVQSFHPNAPPPSDTALLTSGARRLGEASSSYARWLQQLRAVCAEVGIPLIVDEVYTGFRLAPRGAQEYFGVQPDMVVYGKTVAGGMPVGVVCGRKALMRRFDPERPLRVAYVIGTFSAHPVVMGAMNEFLRWLGEPTTRPRYQEMNHRCAQWVRETNRQLTAAAVPLQVAHLATVWTLRFTEPGRYNWLLQYYLRAQGVTLSWVGTGRCLTLAALAVAAVLLSGAVMGRRATWSARRSTTRPRPPAQVPMVSGARLRAPCACRGGRSCGAMLIARGPRRPGRRGAVAARPGGRGRGRFTPASPSCNARGRCCGHDAGKSRQLGPGQSTSHGDAGVDGASPAWEGPAGRGRAGRRGADPVQLRAGGP